MTPGRRIGRATKRRIAKSSSSSGKRSNCRATSQDCCSIITSTSLGQGLHLLFASSSMRASSAAVVFCPLPLAKRAAQGSSRGLLRHISACSGFNKSEFCDVFATFAPTSIRRPKDGSVHRTPTASPDVPDKNSAVTPPRASLTAKSTPLHSSPTCKQPVVTGIPKCASRISKEHLVPPALLGKNSIKNPCEQVQRWVSTAL
mmetsp:Transcript_88090/g.138104  ORF Transcript_88090/g.138104 Transcript_88090/m.138104 type:complete len:202 (-) Transcript_88090:944-1549(-)